MKKILGLLISSVAFASTSEPKGTPEVIEPAKPVVEKSEPQKKKVTSKVSKKYLQPKRSSKTKIPSKARK